MGKSNIGYIGCSIPLIAFVCLVIWIRYDDVVEKRERLNIELLQNKIDRLSDSRNTIDALQQLITMPRIYKNEERLAYNRIVLEYERLGELDSALIWLERVEDKYDETLFTQAHKASILKNKGDTVSSIEILQTILHSDCHYNPMIWPNKIFMQWLNQGHASEYVRFNDYFCEIICKAYAIKMLSLLYKDEEKIVPIVTDFINRTSEIGDIAKNFKEFRDEHPYDEDTFDCEISNMSLNHLYMGDYTRLNSTSKDILSATLICRIGLANDVLLYADSMYTKDRAKDILSNNFMHMPATSFADLLFLRMMKKYYGLDNSLTTSLSYDQFKAIPKHKLRYMTIADPLSLPGSDSYLINHGRTRQFLILKCNEWDIRDSVPFTIEILNRDKGKEKKLIMLKEDYSTDTICFSTDKMGAMLSFKLMPEPVYQMLIYDFFDK
jgi:tetratricopeptide (TPR) repeat protein